MRSELPWVSTAHLRYTIGVIASGCMFVRPPRERSGNNTFGVGDGLPQGEEVSLMHDPALPELNTLIRLVA